MHEFPEFLDLTKAVWPSSARNSILTIASQGLSSSSLVSFQENLMWLIIPQNKVAQKNEVCYYADRIFDQKNPQIDNLKCVLKGRNYMLKVVFSNRLKKYVQNLSIEIKKEVSGSEKVAMNQLQQVGFECPTTISEYPHRSTCIYHL